MIKLGNLSQSLRFWLMSTLGVGPGIGDMFFLVSSGSAYQAWLANQRVPGDHIFTDLPTAYAAMTDQRNDALIVLPGNYYLTAAFPWQLSNCFVLGVNSGTPMSARARFLTLSTVTVTPLITVSGNANVFKNLKFEQAGNHATLAAVCGLVTGIYNRFDHVHFQGGTGALSAADASMRSLVVRAGENIWEDCTIGVTTVARGNVANAELDFDGVGGGARAPRCIFRRCQIQRWSTGVGGVLMNISASGIDRFLLFENSEFINWGTSLTQAFSIAAGQNGDVLLKNTVVKGATALVTGNSSNLYGYAGDGAGTGARWVGLTG